MQTIPSGTPPPGKQPKQAERVIGGIIGTVRFHFDMWGNGVRGAMHLEETGAAQRVHASNTTAALFCKEVSASFRSSDVTLAIQAAAGR